MAIAAVLLGIALAAGLAVTVWWRRTAPGKRMRIGAFTLYYTPAVTPAVANRVADYLVRENFAGQPMDARLTRDGATYQLQLVCSGPPADSQLVACEVLAAGLSDDALAGAAAEVQVCDPTFRPLAVIPHRGRFGRRITMNAGHLFYLGGVTDAEALDVATFLAGVGVFDDSPKVAQMDRHAGGYEFRLAVEVDPLTPEMAEGERRMAGDLSRVLRGAPVAVHFGRRLLGTLRATDPGSAEPGGITRQLPGGPYRAEVFRAPGHGSGRAGPDVEGG